jgi:hypothetical protein
MVMAQESVMQVSGILLCRTCSEVCSFFCTHCFVEEEKKKLSALQCFNRRICASHRRRLIRHLNYRFRSRFSKFGVLEGEIETQQQLVRARCLVSSFEECADIRHELRQLLKIKHNRIIQERKLWSLVRPKCSSRTSSACSLVADEMLQSKIRETREAKVVYRNTAGGQESAAFVVPSLILAGLVFAVTVVLATMAVVRRVFLDYKWEFIGLIVIAILAGMLNSLWCFFFAHINIFYAGSMIARFSLYLTGYNITIRSYDILSIQVVFDFLELVSLFSIILVFCNAFLLAIIDLEEKSQVCAYVCPIFVCCLMGN